MSEKAAGKGTIPMQRRKVRLGPKDLEIPEEWETALLEDLNDSEKPICYGVLKPGEDVDGGTPLIKIEDVVGGRLSSGQEFHQISEEKDQKFQRSRLSGGELLISIQGTVGECAIVPPGLEGANISRTIGRLTPSEINTHYLRYFLTSKPAQDFIEIISSGSTRASYNIGDIRSTKAIVPPVDEQRKIASVLFNLDQAIEWTGKLLEILQRIQSGALRDLCQRGITRKGKLRPEPAGDSNLYRETRWGHFPADWDFRQVSEIVEEDRLVTYGIVQPGDYVEDGIPLIRGQNYIGGWDPLSEFFRVDPELHEEYSRCVTRPGDVILCITGANTGAVNIVPNWIDEANLTQTTARISVDEEVAIPEFVRYALASPVVQEQISAWTRGSAQPGLNLGRVEKFRLPLPDLQEQVRIVSTLEDIRRKIEKEREVRESLSTLKQGLMQDLLSGEVRTHDKEIDVLPEVKKHG